MCVRLDNNLSEEDFKEQWNKVDDYKGVMSADNAYKKFQESRCVLNDGGWNGAGGYRGRFPNLYRYTSDKTCGQAYVCNKDTLGKDTCNLRYRPYHHETPSTGANEKSYISGETPESSPNGIVDAYITKNECLGKCQGYKCEKDKCEVSPWAESEYATIED